MGLNVIDQHSIGLKLVPVLIGELYLARKLKHPGYLFNNGIFEEVFQAGTSPAKDKIQFLMSKNVREIFLFEEDVTFIKDQFKDALIKVSRSLSVGDPLKNGSRQLQLLTMNFRDLYRDPHNDELLKTQFQTTLNMTKFLMENKKIHQDLFNTFDNDNFHFTVTQPLLSSLLLIAFMQQTRMFHEKDIESIFMTSYFKDFGMALLPTALYDKRNPNEHELEILSGHADFSYDLLNSRVPMSKNNLIMIKNHHYLNDKLKVLLNKNQKSTSSEDFVSGVDTAILSATDILVAMTHERPYRTEGTTYQALEILKKLIADDYPQEFKAFVVFIRAFFKN